MDVGVTARPTRAPLPRVAIVTVAALVGVVITDIASVVAETHRYQLVGSVVRSPGSVSMPALKASDDAVTRVLVLWLVLLLITAVGFITWLYQSAAAADRIRPDALTHRPLWAIWGWFVPFLNLVRPPRMVADVDKATHPPGPIPRADSTLIWSWWLTFLASAIVARIAASTRTDAGDPNVVLDAIQAGDRLSAIGDVVDAAAACLAIAVIVRVGRRVAVLKARQATAGRPTSTPDPRLRWEAVSPASDGWSQPTPDDWARPDRP